MIKAGSEKHKKFIEEHFITCECGYFNKKGRIDNYGFCLRCGKVLDEKAYLKYRVRMESLKGKQL